MDCKCYQHSHCKHCEHHYAQRSKDTLQSWDSKTFLDMIAPMMKNKETTQFLNLVLVMLLKDLGESNHHSFSNTKQYNLHPMKHCKCAHVHPNQRKYDHYNNHNEEFCESSSYHTTRKCKGDHHRPSEQMNQQMESTSSSNQHRNHKMNCQYMCHHSQNNLTNSSNEKMHSKHAESTEEMIHYMESTSSSSSSFSEHRKNYHTKSACKYHHPNDDKDKDKKSHHKQSNSNEISEEMFLLEVLVQLKDLGLLDLHPLFTGANMPFESIKSSSTNNQDSQHSHCSCHQDSHNDDDHNHRKDYTDSSSHEHGRKRKTRYFKDLSKKSSRKTTTFSHYKKYY